MAKLSLRLSWSEWVGMKDGVGPTNMHARTIKLYYKTQIPLSNDNKGDTNRGAHSFHNRKP